MLLAAISGSADVLVTGDTNLGHQQNLKKFNLAIILVRPPRLVVDQIIPLIPEVVAAFPTAKRHAVTTIGRPKVARSTPKPASAARPTKPQPKPTPKKRAP